MIKTTRHAFIPFCSFALFGCDPECTVVKSSVERHTYKYTHAHAHIALRGKGGDFSDTPPDLLTLTAWSGVACPARKNCRGIDMLFIISYCINYIKQNGKEERRNGRGGRGNLVFVPCAFATVIGSVAISASTH